MWRLSWLGVSAEGSPPPHDARARGGIGSLALGEGRWGPIAVGVWVERPLTWAVLRASDHCESSAPCLPCSCTGSPATDPSVVL